jgi:hypothetical protein
LPLGGREPGGSGLPFLPLRGRFPGGTGCPDFEAGGLLFGRAEFAGPALTGLPFVCCAFAGLSPGRDGRGELDALLSGRDELAKPELARCEFAGLLSGRDEFAKPLFGRAEFVGLLSFG